MSINELGRWIETHSCDHCLLSRRFAKYPLQGHAPDVILDPPLFQSGPHARLELARLTRTLPLRVGYAALRLSGLGKANSFIGELAMRRHERAFPTHTIGEQLQFGVFLDAIL